MPALTGVAATSRAGGGGDGRLSDDHLLSSDVILLSGGSAFGPTVSHALTGVSASSAAGSVARFPVALTGNAATTTAGALAHTFTKVLTGNTRTSATGTVGASGPSPIALTGIVATGSTGTLGRSSTVAVTGNTRTGTVGDFAFTGVLQTGTVATPIYIVEVELDGVGAGWTNLGQTGDNDVLITGFKITYGIDGSEPIDLMAGSALASFVLDNSASNSAGTLGYYSLYHVNKRPGWGLGNRCRIRLIDLSDASSHVRFIGRIDSIDPMPGVRRERQVLVTATCWLEEASRWALTPDIGEQVGLRGDEILTNILAAMPSQPTATSFDVGMEAYPFALDTSVSAHTPVLEEFGKLARSEGGLIYLRADGTLRYEGRHARMLDTTSDWTLTDADIVDLEIPSSREDIRNTVRVTYHPKIVDPLPTTLLYDQTNPIFVEAGTTKFLLGPYRDPNTGDQIGGVAVQDQVAGTDYTANTAENGTGTDLTASFSIVVTKGSSGAAFNVTNSSGVDGWLTRNRLYGKGVYDRGAVSVDATDDYSVELYGERVAQFDMEYQAINEVAQGAAGYFRDKYKNPLAQVRRVVVIGDEATKVTQILRRDISDRLSITETVTGVDNAFFINAIELEALPTRHLQATYTLAPAQDPFAGQLAVGLWWILGTSVLGSGTIPAPF
jgi:hypothetical protein